MTALDYYINKCDNDEKNLIYKKQGNKYLYQSLNTSLINSYKANCIIVLPKLIEVIEGYYKPYKRFTFTLIDLIEFIEDNNPTNLLLIEMVLIICFIETLEFIDYNIGGLLNDLKAIEKSHNHILKNDYGLKRVK